MRQLSVGCYPRTYILGSPGQLFWPFSFITDCPPAFPIASTMSRWLVLILLTAFSCCHAAEPTLHERIDQLVEAKFMGEPARLADDAEFLRRVHLDLAGCIPAAQQTREFLQNSSPDKRRRVIDRLLNAPGYVERMTDLFHVMLMERRGDNEDWNRFLRFSFEQNRPWDSIVRDILLPDRQSESLRGAAYFYTRRLEKSGQNPTDFPGLTRDVGRLFLGVDLQCAECHDHLFIDDYTQRDFQGLFAVYSNLSIRKEKFPAINERAMSQKLQFVSVLEDNSGETGPRVPFGREFEIPAPPQTDEAQTKRKKKPDPNEPPYFSALGLIADELPRTDNQLFCRNIANRLWFVMMGRGLVEPLDQFHSSNQATHPDLLAMLADQLVQHDFDIKWLLREIALSQTYQRSSRMPDDGPLPPQQTYQLAEQRRLTPSQIFNSVLQATGNRQRLSTENGEDSEELEELRKRFVDTFASEPKEPALDYSPAVKQALFLLNDEKLLGLFRQQPGNLFDRLVELAEPKLPDELFLNIYCRLPTEDERKMIRNFIAKNPRQPKSAVEQLAWAMISSMEFCTNH